MPFHPPHPPYRRMGPIGRFVRARLRRRIFAWFAGGVLTTAIGTALVMMLVARVQEPPWSGVFQKGTAWFGAQFAREWDDAARRDEFARKTAQDLELNLELVDAKGARLALFGEVCQHHPVLAPVVRDGVRLGTVRACFGPMPGTWRLPVALFIGVGLLWIASGRVARRLARPLDELTEVVKKIGAGDLKARAEWSCHEPDEIGVVADAVNEMAGRIEKQVSDQRELLATVSHELRTPLARVRVISEIARDSGATPKTFDDLDREVEEMDALVGQLLASSRVEFGMVAKRELSVQDVVRRALERAGLAAEKAAIAGVETVDADPTLLQRALANLLDNAAKHGGGVDAVTVTRAASAVRFEVLDRGPGLPPEGEARLFEKFQRSTGQAGGLGLGLALVRRIAEAHGGRVFAGNRDGGGAAIGFELPPGQAGPVAGGRQG